MEEREGTGPRVGKEAFGLHGWGGWGIVLTPRLCQGRARGRVESWVVGE